MNILYWCLLFLCALAAIFELNAAIKVTTGINTAEPVPSNATIKPRIKKRTGKQYFPYRIVNFKLTYLNFGK